MSTTIPYKLLREEYSQCLGKWVVIADIAGTREEFVDRSLERAHALLDRRLGVM